MLNNKKQINKKCKVCGFESKDLNFFVRSHNTLKSGDKSSTCKNLCKICKNKMQRDKPCRSLTTKVKYIRLVKSSPCVDCNTSYPFCVMDFDHCRGVKLFGIANHSGRTLEEIKLEIEKCDLVCSNCHRIRTHDRRENKLLMV